MTTEADVAAAFLTEINGHILLTAPATAVGSLDDFATREMAAEYEQAAASSSNKLLMHLTGRFVEAEKANVNGAFWNTSDLEFGETSIIHAPVNFLHRARHVIGTFTESRLYKTPPAEAAAKGITRPFIGVNAVAWREFFAHECRMLEIASDAKLLFWSMECQSKTVRCETAADGSRTGCGREYPFAQVFPTPASNVCAHVREKSSQRHFNLPRFNAGAVIVPPVRPGWRDASVEVRAEAAKLAETTFAEAANARDIDEATAVELMAQVVQFGHSLQPA